MTEDLKRQVLEHLEKAVALVSGRADAKTRRLLVDTKRMVGTGKWERTIESRSYEEAITYVVPKP